MNMTATSANNASQYNATLKGKITGLEETCKALTEELTFYHNEIGTLRSEKQDLEQNLARKTADIRQQLTDDVCSAEEEMKRNHTTQKTEN